MRLSLFSVCVCVCIYVSKCAAWRIKRAKIVMRIVSQRENEYYKYRECTYGYHHYDHDEFVIFGLLLRKITAQWWHDGWTGKIGLASRKKTTLLSLLWWWWWWWLAGTQRYLIIT